MPVNILTTTVSIPFNKVSKNNLDNLILRDLKNKYEEKCCSHGYTKEGSVSIIQRSQGRISSINNISSILCSVNYKIDTIHPQKGDIIDCIVNNSTKMGTIAYSYYPDKKYTFKTSPVLIIIPISEESSHLNPDEKIEVEVITSKIKYNSPQIQVIGKLNV
tara:strand:- start:1590 stop:2072 length:483 start_codon:yes stop_codon:yes gene_type:complete